MWHTSDMTNVSLWPPTTSSTAISELLLLSCLFIWQVWQLISLQLPTITLVECRKRQGENSYWWNHANHYLLVPLLQFKKASVYEEETKGENRKGSQINNDNGLVFFYVFLLSFLFIFYWHFGANKSWKNPLNLVNTYTV